MSILDDIIAKRKISLAATMEQLPLGVIEESARTQLPIMFDFKAALTHETEKGINIIAEVKKASPSKGIICENFNPLAIARDYHKAGAAALSVLTEEDYFLGCNDYLQEISRSVNLPTLRKDFIIHPYQIFEARCLGANAYLLIVACLSDTDLRDFISMGREVSLEPLVEVHTEKELDRALACDARIIGINNRNLATFETSLDTTASLRPKIPDSIAVVSESGISTSDHMRRLKDLGVDAVLIGESFMRRPNHIGLHMAELLDF